MSRARGLRLAVLAMLLPFAAHAETWTVDRLMGLLAAEAGGRVRFVERKYLAILDAPVESRGEMRFVPPGRLERHTTSPRAETMVLDGDHLSIARDGRTLALRLRDYPEAAAFIDSIRGTLAGDRRALEQRFHLSLAGSRSAWSLDLLPSDPHLADLVLRIHVEGSGARIRSLEILQGDGDRSVMTIEPLPAAGDGGAKP